MLCSYQPNTKSCPWPLQENRWRPGTPDALLPASSIWAALFSLRTWLSAEFMWTSHVTACYVSGFFMQCFRAESPCSTLKYFIHFCAWVMLHCRLEPCLWWTSELLSACVNSAIKNISAAGRWWCTPLIPALGSQRQADFWVRGQPGLQSEFQDSQGYTEKPCLKKKEKKRKKKDFIIIRKYTVADFRQTRGGY